MRRLRLTPAGHGRLRGPIPHYAITAALLCACLATAFAPSLSPAASDIDLGALTRETQQQYQDAERLEILWWLPVQLWAAVLQGDPPGGSRQDALQNFNDHLIFFVAEANISPLGGVTFQSSDKTRKRLRLFDTKGNRVAPLTEDKIPEDLLVLINTLLPALAGSAGAVGQNFHPFVFAVTDASGARIASPRDPGQLQIALGDHTYRWRLPLASLLPKKRCPVDGEELSGAFNFCPYHGAKLEPLPATTSKDKPDKPAADEKRATP